MSEMYILKSGIQAQVMLAFIGMCLPTGLSPLLEWICVKS